MNTFEKDNDKGTKTEQKIAEALGIIYIGNKTSSHDIIVSLNNVDVMIEIKDETNHKNTGNLCIEMHRGGEVASCLSVSKAKYQVHYFCDDELFVYHTGYMRLLLFRMLILGYHKEGEKIAVREKFSKKVSNAGGVLLDKHIKHKAWYKSTTLANLKETLEKMEKEIKE